MNDTIKENARIDTPTLDWLEDPTVFAVNRLPACSDHVCFAPGDDPAGESSLRQSLCGRWQFAYSPAPAARPAGFWQPEYDDSAFGEIQVPGHIELQGYGQIQYINTLYPWDGHAALRPPKIDWDDAPVGSYVRRFDLAPALRGQRVCIRFEGAEQVIYVWLNGHFVGYAEDSFTPSDFDLTPFIQDTGNRLCVEVYKRSSASWLEDQDFFRFSGLFRPVYLYAKPRLHLADLWLRAGLEGESTGRLTVRLKLEGEAAALGTAAVRCRITAPAASGVAPEPLYDGPLALHPAGPYVESGPLTFAHVIPWCHEHPALYEVTLTLSIGGEPVEPVEIIPYRIGFRRFELVDGVMRLNGERIVFRGVNRHEWSAEKGRAIGPDEMRVAMDVFCRNNINAVRTCHYPNQTLWYQLCDEHGIYMIDEANLETHGSWQKNGRIDPEWNVPGNRPEWKECVVDRARSMFERDKNHPAILLWSCGNESYAGEDILAMAEFFRRQDPSRLVHYEGVYNNRAYPGCTDIESRMYAKPAEIREHLLSKPQKPFILCEYMHDMGNSLGGMESYIQLEEEFEQYQGGFVWDFMDQALWHTDCRGNRVLGYGGDFGERQTDYAFSANGIVFANGAEKPAMQELRYWYSGRAARAAFDAQNAKAAKAARAAAAARPARIPAALRVVHGDGAVGVKGKGFELLFSYPEGGPVSLVSGGRQWLWRAPRLAYWRAPTENDIGCGFARQSAVWAAAEHAQTAEGPRILREGEAAVSLQYAYTTPAMPGLCTTVTYTVQDTGALTVAVRYEGAAGRPGLPLLGLRFATPAPLECIQWLGLSGETYPDRKKGGRFGWHTAPISIPAYLVPQECGCHVDTQAARLTLPGGPSLALEMAEDGAPFAFSAIPYTPAQLAEAAHREELPAPVRTVVTVCGAMRGVGGIDSWGAEVEEAYQIPSDRDIEFSFVIQL